MQRAIFIALITLAPPLVAHGRLVEDRAFAHRLIDRAMELSRDGSSYTYAVPPSSRRDYAGLARSLKQALFAFRDAEKYRRKDDPFIIYSTDPAAAVAVAHMALSDCPARSLRGMRIICIVGTEYAAFLRAPGAAAGARLEVVPVPQRPNHAMERTADRCTVHF